MDNENTVGLFEFDACIVIRLGGGACMDQIVSDDPVDVAFCGDGGVRIVWILSIRGGWIFTESKADSTGAIDDGVSFDEGISSCAPKVDRVFCEASVGTVDPDECVEANLPLPSPMCVDAPCVTAAKTRLDIGSALACHL